MNLRKIRSTYQCELRVVSPVHIGCGKKFIQHFDFLEENGKIKVFDHNRLFSQVQSAGPEAITAFTAALESQSLGDFIRSHKINFGDALLQTCSINPRMRTPDEICRYIHDGSGRPIVPGSSLKGVFRTAILSRLAEEDSRNFTSEEIEKIKPGNQIKPKFADKSICSHLLGTDAKLNLMRSLTVADFTFKPSSVKIAEACVNRLSSPKVFSRKHLPLYVERLRQGESATGQISFDEYLQDEAEGKDMFRFKARLSCKWLIDALRMRTQRFLKNEMEFLEDKNGFGVPEMKQFYARLEKEQSQLLTHEAIIQFAWGSGWKGMTGELIDKNQLTSDRRRILQLAPQHIPLPFPKSRRLSLSGQTIEPFGWIKLSFIEKGKVIGALKPIEISPKQKLLEGLDKVGNWGQLLQMNLDKEEMLELVADKDIGKSIERAAIRVHQLFHKNWEMSRDIQVSEWLKRSGIAWQPMAKEVEKPITPSSSPMLEIIQALQSLDAYRTAGIKIHQLDQQSAEALKAKFSNWGITKKTKGKSEQAEFQKLVKRLNQIS